MNSVSSTFFDSSVFSFSAAQWTALLPYLWLSAGLALSTIAAGFRAQTNFLRALSVFIFAPYIYLMVAQLGLPSVTLLGNGLGVDAITRIVGAGIGVFALLASQFASAGSARQQHPEWLALIVSSVLSLSLIPGARDFVSFFVYLEAAAIAGYVMAALDTDRSKSLESGLKYLFLGAFASALFLMSMTLFYGLSGSFDYLQIGEGLSALSGIERGMGVAAGVLLISSLMFKVGLAPFHMWSADVYQGGPTALVAYLAAATKLSVFTSAAVLLHRTGLFKFDYVQSYIATLSIISVLVGSFLAMAQFKVRRMLAYSGIVNAGYAGLALAAGPKASGALVTSLLFYGAVLIALFALIEVFVNALSKEAHSDLDIKDLAEAANRLPIWVVVLFSAGIFSLAGIPPLPGFFGKYLVIKDLWTLGAHWSTYTMLAGAILGVGYYLRALVPLALNPAESSQNKNFSKSWTVFVAFVAIGSSVLLMGGLNRLPQWIHSIEGFAR